MAIFRPLTAADLLNYVPLRIRPRHRRWRYAAHIYRLFRQHGASRRLAFSQWWFAMTWMPKQD